MSNIIHLEDYRASEAAAQREEARQWFGCWEDWSASEIDYLLHELADGHWEDCGEKVPGFAVALGGLNIAIGANKGDYDTEGLRSIVNGMWVASDYLCCIGFEDEIDPRIKDALKTVWEATRFAAR